MLDISASVSILKWDMWFLQRCCWICRSYGIWRRVCGPRATAVPSKRREPFTQRHIVISQTSIFRYIRFVRSVVSFGKLWRHACRLYNAKGKCAGAVTKLKHCGTDNSTLLNWTLPLCWYFWSSAVTQCFSTARPREILLELITNLNVILYLSTHHTVHIIVLILFMIMP